MGSWAGFNQKELVQSPTVYGYNSTKKAVEGQTWGGTYAFERKYPSQPVSIFAVAKTAPTARSDANRRSASLLRVISFKSYLVI